VNLRWKIPLLYAALAVAFAAPLVRAQAPAGPITPPANLPEQPRPTVRVKVAVVSTPVTVRDRQGDLVLHLEQKDFRLLDDGVEQKIEHFDLGAGPLSVVLVVENSDRIVSLLPEVRNTGILLSQKLMAGDVELAVLSYADIPELRQDFTTSGDAVERAMSKLPPSMSGAVLYDALSKGVAMLSRRANDRRRILLVIAEPVDKGSESKLSEVLRDAQLQNVTIYSVALSSTAAALRHPPREPAPSPYPPGAVPGPPGVPQTPSTVQAESASGDLGAVGVWIVQHVKGVMKDNVLEVAAVATGGRNISAFKASTVEKALSEIADELHAQYTLAYRPTAGNKPGFHKIEVEVDHPDLRVRSRPGYYLE
jgi:VWFA-related protein